MKYVEIRSWDAKKHPEWFPVSNYMPTQKWGWFAEARNGEILVVYFQYPTLLSITALHKMMTSTCM